MDRKIYQPTSKQQTKWAQPGEFQMPTDEQFKEMASKGRKPWGLVKRDWLLDHAANSYEYQMGLWQGRVDAANGLEYSEERSEKTYNVGYYRGYTEYESNRRGWDENTRTKFDQTYVN